jgi:subtilisin-like proprotein convertase family protein
LKATTCGEIRINIVALIFLFFLGAGCSFPWSDVEDSLSQFIIEDDPEYGKTKIPVPPATIDDTQAQDPFEQQAWHIRNTGQKSFAAEGGEEGEDINSIETRGEGIGGENIKIAVSDNGVEIYHKDLVANSWFGNHRNYLSSNSDYWNGDPTPTGSENYHAHGTAVTGILAAQFNNGKGSYGVAHAAKFGAFLYIGAPFGLIKSLDQTNGPFDVFNYSYGRYTCMFQEVPDIYIDQLAYGVKNLRQGKGSIYVKAAGNEYVSYLSDCVEEDDGFYLGNASLEKDNSFPYMIVVGANNSRGVSANYSTPGSSLWISAPGGDYGISYPAILTTDLSGCEKGYASEEHGETPFDKGELENSECDYTSTMNGTSAATPIVSAAAAVILGVSPNLSWRDVKYIMALSARKIDPTREDSLFHPFAQTLNGAVYEYGWQENSKGFHFHNYYGLGALDLDKAVSIAKSFPSIEGALLETSWRNDSGQIDLSIPDVDPVGVTSEITITDNLSIEAVQISLQIEHPHASELGVVLESPSGMVSNLLYYNSGIAQGSIENEIILSNAFLGESAAGTWKLKVFDATSGNTGQLKNWKLNFWGHYPDEHEEKRVPTYYKNNVAVEDLDQETNQQLSTGSLSVSSVESSSAGTSSLARGNVAGGPTSSVVAKFRQAMLAIKSAAPEAFEQQSVLEAVFIDNGELYFLFVTSDGKGFFNQRGDKLTTFSKTENVKFLEVVENYPINFSKKTLRLGEILSFDFEESILGASNSPGTVVATGSGKVIELHKKEGIVFQKFARFAAPSDDIIFMQNDDFIFKVEGKFEHWKRAGNHVNKVGDYKLEGSFVTNDELILIVKKEDGLYRVQVDKPLEYLSSKKFENVLVFFHEGRGFSVEKSEMSYVIEELSLE